jgi:hypothetical protein
MNVVGKLWTVSRTLDEGIRELQRRDGVLGYERDSFVVWARRATEANRRFAFAHILCGLHVLSTNYMPSIDADEFVTLTRFDGKKIVLRSARDLSSIIRSRE